MRYHNVQSIQSIQLSMLYTEPSSIVLYTLAESGYVGFYDPTAADNGDLYFVARSLRPVGVAYDPVDKVYHCQSLLTVGVDNCLGDIFDLGIRIQVPSGDAPIV